MGLCYGATTSVIIPVVVSSRAGSTTRFVLSSARGTPSVISTSTLLTSGYSSMPSAVESPLPSNSKIYLSRASYVVSRSSLINVMSWKPSTFACSISFSAISSLALILSSSSEPLRRSRLSNSGNWGGATKIKRAGKALSLTCRMPYEDH